MIPYRVYKVKFLVKREPHLLKLELTASLASVHLAAKSYIMVDSSSVMKSGHKGEYSNKA